MPALPPRGKPKKQYLPSRNPSKSKKPKQKPASTPHGGPGHSYGGLPGQANPPVHPASAPPPVVASPAPSAPTGTAQNAISPKQKPAKARRGMTMAEEKAINRRAKNRKAGKVMRKAVLKTRKPEARRERKSDSRLGRRPENPKGKKPRVPKMPNGPKLPPKT